MKVFMDIGVPRMRAFACWTIMLLCPLSLSAADQRSAVVHSQGGVWLNGSEVSGTIAVMSGDLLETKPGFAANLDAEGSSILIQPESIIKFQGTFLSLEHGSVAVGTSTEMGVQIKCLKVEPVSLERTQYEVTDLSGTVQVAARRNDVNISVSGTGKAASASAPGQSAIVHEGEQTTRDESVVCGTPPPQQPESAGNTLNSKWLKIGGAAAGGGLLLCLLLCKSSSPISPAQP